jgi:hypothetical protein
MKDLRASWMVTEKDTTIPIRVSVSKEPSVNVGLIRDPGFVQGLSTRH